MKREKPDLRPDLKRFENWKELLRFLLTGERFTDLQITNITEFIGCQTDTFRDGRNITKIDKPEQRQLLDVYSFLKDEKTFTKVKITTGKRDYTFDLPDILNLCKHGLKSMLNEGVSSGMLNYQVHHLPVSHALADTYEHLLSLKGLNLTDPKAKKLTYRIYLEIGLLQDEHWKTMKSSERDRRMKGYFAKHIRKAGS